MTQLRVLYRCAQVLYKFVQVTGLTSPQWQPLVSDHLGFAFWAVAYKRTGGSTVHVCVVGKIQSQVRSVFSLQCRLNVYPVFNLGKPTITLAQS